MESLPLAFEDKVSLGLESLGLGFVSYRLPTDARQDDDEGDQCGQEDGDDNSQSSVHWKGWLGASVEGQRVSKSSHFGGGTQGC